MESSSVGYAGTGWEQPTGAEPRAGCSAGLQPAGKERTVLGAMQIVTAILLGSVLLAGFFQLKYRPYRGPAVRETAGLRSAASSVIVREHYGRKLNSRSSIYSRRVRIDNALAEAGRQLGADDNGDYQAGTGWHIQLNVFAYQPIEIKSITVWRSELEPNKVAGWSTDRSGYALGSMGPLAYTFIGELNNQAAGRIIRPGWETIYLFIDKGSAEYLPSFIEMELADGTILSEPVVSVEYSAEAEPPASGNRPRNGSVE